MIEKEYAYFYSLIFWFLFFFCYQVLLADTSFGFIFVAGFTGIPGSDVSASAAPGFSLLILGKMKSSSKKNNRHYSKYYRYNQFHLSLPPFFISKPQSLNKGLYSF